MIPDHFLWPAIPGEQSSGASLRDVKNDSRSFFVACHPWRTVFGRIAARR